MRGTWVVIALAGCMNHTYDTRPAPGSGSDTGSGSGSDVFGVDHADPHSCEKTDTMSGLPTTNLSASFTLGPDSVGWCLTLDATQNLREAHFGGQGPNVAGGQSGVAFKLLDATTLDDLVDGWDLTVDDELGPAQHSWATIEYGVLAGNTQTVILRVRAIDTRTDSLSISLFEPFE